jgi:hypothetical protein
MTARRREITIHLAPDGLAAVLAGEPHVDRAGKDQLGQALELKLPRFHERSSGSDHSFMSIFLASYSMGER